jgi:hypothetical protein
MMVKQLNKCVTTTFTELDTAYEKGDSATVHELGGVLVSLASVSEDPDRNQLDLYGYLVKRQITLRRHDRAVDLAVKMIFLARTRGNVYWITEALLTIGKVHLAFGHLDALVRVWERLVDDLRTVSGTFKPILRTWTFCKKPGVSYIGGSFRKRHCTLGCTTTSAGVTSSSGTSTRP